MASARKRSRFATIPSVQALASLGPASRTAFKIFSTEGLKKKSTFLATVLPSTWTVSSPRFPFTTSTSTPGSFRKASATRAACSRVPPQSGHSRMVTFFIADLPPIFLIRLRAWGTITLSRVSGMRTLAVSLITALLLGAVKLLCHGLAHFDPISSPIIRSQGRACPCASDRGGKRWLQG
jgi:hypothetical protein